MEVKARFKLMGLNENMIKVEAEQGVSLRQSDRIQKPDDDDDDDDVNDDDDLISQSVV
jgi:hypothetical protein